MLYIAGTGTRSIQTAAVEEKRRIMNLVCDKLRDWVEVRGQDGVTVISGCAEGFDAALASAAMRLSLPLIACVPNPGYGKYYWGEHSRTGEDRIKAFHCIIDYATEVEYTNEYYGVGKALTKDGLHLNFWRNQRMVDRCDVLFAWAKGPKDADGGTNDCIKRALAADLMHIEYLQAA